MLHFTCRIIVATEIKKKFKIIIARNRNTHLGFPYVFSQAAGHAYKRLTSKNVWIAMICFALLFPSIRLTNATVQIFISLLTYKDRIAKQRHSLNYCHLFLSISSKQFWGLWRSLTNNQQYYWTVEVACTGCSRETSAQNYLSLIALSTTLFLFIAKPVFFMGFATAFKITSHSG